MECKKINENKVEVDEIITIDTPFGLAEIISFNNLPDGKEHIVFAFGDWRNAKDLTVRLHSECLTGDVFGSKRCDCGPQLQEAMRTFASSSGLIVYLRQEGRGIGLNNKLRAYRLQDSGLDTYQANRALGFGGDERDYTVAAQMLLALGKSEVRLLSNNPRKANGLIAAGVRVRDRVFTQTFINPSNQRYLSAKSKSGGHDGLDAEVILGVIL